MKTFSKLFFLLALVFGASAGVRAQASLADDKAMKADEVDSLIKNKNYVFEATPVNPKTSVAVYHKYSVGITRDTLVAWLPGPTGKDTAKISCTSYDYHVAKNEKGNRLVYIKPNSAMGDVRQLSIDITPTGRATLRVVKNGGATFTLEGYIKQETY
jgi:hypothetical protein